MNQHSIPCFRAVFDLFFTSFVQATAGVPYWQAIVMVSVAAKIAVLPAVTTFVSMRSTGAARCQTQFCWRLASPTSEARGVWIRREKARWLSIEGLEKLGCGAHFCHELP